MPRYDVERPIPAPDCFREHSAAATLSRAAGLLVLGWRCNQAAEEGGASGTAPSYDALVPQDDLAPFASLAVRAASRVPTVSEIEAGLGAAIDPGRYRGLLPEFADRLSAPVTIEEAMAVLVAALRAGEPIERVAAAAALQGLVDPVEVCAPACVPHLFAEDRLLRDLARATLARASPSHPALGRLSDPGGAGPAGGAAHTALIVHGTFAQESWWWQPGGDFHAYLHGEVRPDVYSGLDRFSWSGQFSEAARAGAARDLRIWVRERGLEGLDLYAHSHGGTVAMGASRLGLRIGKLLLLSCPAGGAEELPDFERVGSVISVRTRFDLVLWVIGAGQRFRHPRIAEHVLEIWYGHSETHEPEVWRKFHVPRLTGDAPAEPPAVR